MSPISGSKLFHEQDRYEDADATLEWTATLHDGLSPYSEVTVDGKLTVVVDAVAKAEEIHLGFPVLDKEAGTLTQTLTFDDHESNEQHYAVIAPDLYRVVGKQAHVRGADGEWHAVAVETIFSPDGTPYYAVLLDGYLDAAGSATVRFEMHELNIPGIENYPVVSGGVSIEPNTGFFPEDREPVLTNNWVINTEVKFIHEGNVSTKDIGLTADFIVEDDAAGAPFHFNGEMGAHDMLVSAILAFSATDGAGLGDAGDQIATIVYAGNCYAVIVDGAGNASADIPFGENGFDPAADFRIIWGVAHMEGGKVVVDAFNHDADGRLNFSTTFTVKNQLSNTETTLTATDGNGIDLIPRADAAQNVLAEATAINGRPAQPTDWIGAGADSVTITLSASFEDLDGSESHYLMLEVPQGYEVVSPAGDTHVYSGVHYYRVQVDGTEANPTVSVTLRVPDGLNQTAQLRSAAMSVEHNGQHTQYTQGPDVVLRVSDVSANAVDASVPPVLEDAMLSLSALADAALLGADANDTLLSVTFTDLKGGTLVDASGNPLSGMTFTKAELASGQVFYRPATNYAGELDALGRPLPVNLTYNALLGETNTGATATLTGQTLTLTIIPVADAPASVSGSTSATELGNVQTGHKAAISVTLSGDFEDVDGSEAHFFIVSAPAGVAVLDGAGYTLTTLNAEELAALNGFDPAFAASGTVYKIVLADSMAASVTLPVNLEVTTTLYNGGQLALVGDASELLADGTRDYGFTAAPSVTLPPAIEHGIGNLDPVPQESDATLDSLRQTVASGSLVMEGIDPDGDDIVITGVTGGVLGQDAGRIAYVVEGAHGTLYLYENGEYRYQLHDDAHGVAAEEVFTYTVADGYGGTGQSSITISLTTPNTAPSAQDAATTLDSVRATTATGTLTLADSEGDAVSVAAVNGSNVRVNFGTEDSPLWGFEAAGQYGTIRVYEDADGQWRYEYVLDPTHRGEERDETFTFTVRDEYGMESESAIAIDLYNVNAAPVAGAGAATLDTLRDADGITSGAAALTDPDGDHVSLSSASGVQGAGQWGEDEAGTRAYIVRGEHGDLYLYEGDGSSLSYRYVLTDTTPGGLDATETFTYTVDDGFLGTASGVITIDLNNANASPVINGDLAGELDTLRSATGQTGGTLVFNDPDYNPDQGRHDLVTLSGASFNGVAATADGQGGFTVSGAYGVFHIDASGAYTYTLNPDAAGTRGEAEEFQITVTDEFGLESTETVRVDLVVHNQNPTVSSGRLTLDTWRGGGNASGGVTLRDADGDTVTVTAVTGIDAGIWGADPDGNPAFVTQGAYGTLYVHEDGTYAYVLAEGSTGASGTDSFGFTVRDDFGGSASGNIVIDLNNANAAPVLTGNLSGAIKGSVQDYASGIIRESGQIAWSDADGDAIDAVTVGGVSLPASGEISIEGGYGTLVVTTDGGMSASWTYTLKPSLDSQGITDVDSFAIVVRDIYGAEASRSLDVALTPLAHAPECEDLKVDWPKTAFGQPVSFYEGVLPFSDADMNYNPSETLQLTVNNTVITSRIELQGQYGTLTIDADGSFVYRSESHIGQDVLEVFTYKVTDGTGKSDEAHLYIRLGDNAPAFPDEETEIVQSGENQALDDASTSDAWADAPEAAPEPEPVEVSLLNVPLPYDPADPGVGLAV